MQSFEHSRNQYELGQESTDNEATYQIVSPEEITEIVFSDKQKHCPYETAPEHPHLVYFPIILEEKNVLKTCPFDFVVLIIIHLVR